MFHLAEDVTTTSAGGGQATWPKSKGMSIKDILTQEYQKSNEVVSLEEEMEEEVCFYSMYFY